MNKRGRLWTVSSVNLVLPLVRAYAEGMQEDFLELRAAGDAARALRRRLRLVWQVESDRAGVPPETWDEGVRLAMESGNPELVRLQERIRDAAVRIDRACADLTRDIGEGVTLRSYEFGRFDFPTTDGGPAYLCWQPSDGDRVIHRHEPDLRCPERLASFTTSH